MSRDFFQASTGRPHDQCERDHAEYNRIVDYLDSPELERDLREIWSDSDEFVRLEMAGRAGAFLRRKLRDQLTPEGWQPLPDDDHDAPPELTNGPLWLATTRGDVRPGYYRQADGNPTVWSSEPTEGVFKWWRPMDAEPPSLGAQPPTPDYARQQPSRDVSTHSGIVTHIRDRWVDVHLDGEDDDETVGCRNESGVDLAIGDTVVTQFVPPHTVYVILKLKGGAGV